MYPQSIKQNIAITLYLCLCIMLFACKSTTENTSNASTSVPSIPGIPEEIMVKLLNECTFVDYIFKNEAFSVSQSEDPSIDQNIMFIDIKKPLGQIPKDCTPSARKFFHIDGKIVFDVDVYLTPQCKFYVFVDKDNKPLYANHMTEAGVIFYSRIAQQARGVNPQGQ